MSQHRFRELVRRPVAATPVGFVSCPLAAFAAAQQSAIAEVYRIAADRTREQLAAYRRYVAPAFSTN